MNKKVLVIGAGLSGIATALRLAKKGYEVHIIEKNDKPGGRLHQLKKDGFTFDMGPSFFSMSYEFEEFAKDCGIELPFKYVELDPLYTVNIEGKDKTFVLYKDLKKLAEQFKDEEPDFEESMTKYLSKAGKLFHDTIDVVIKRNYDSKLLYILGILMVNPLHIPVVFRSFYKQVKRNFKSKTVQQIISLVAFFLGGTPFDTMAVYTLLSYTEFKHDGYFNVAGGMYKIVEGIVRELEKAGVKITYNTEIIEYKGIGKKLEYVVDKNGNKWDADIFLVNADAAVFRNSVFKRPAFSHRKMLKKKWTMGYLTIYLGIKTKLPQVHHHNYFLGADFEAYANSFMQDPGTLKKPYYYVNVMSKNNPECAPEGCEGLFFVCPVPNLIHKPNWDNKNEIVNSIIDDFSKRIGKDISSEIITKTVYTPQDWGEHFNLFKGSGLGLSHNLSQIGAYRPANFDEVYKNVFYAGASTAPGAGLPMAIIGSKLAAERILKY